MYARIVYSLTPFRQKVVHQLSHRSTRVALRACLQLARLFTCRIQWWQREIHRQRLPLWRARRPQMEAGMVPANTPRGALAAGPMVGALIVQLGAQLVPELVTSTLSYMRVAIVARSVWQRSSRGSWLRRRTMALSRDIGIWVAEPRHWC